MLKIFKKCLPDMFVRSVFELDEEFYRSRGIKGVIFDIDNTLVRHTEAVPPAEITEYFSRLDKWGVRAAVVSNNKKERVQKFCAPLGVPYAARAYKPRRKPLRTVAAKLGVPPDEICLVGDQLFTDIFGANRMGFFSVAVTALGENETGFVSFKRFFENLLLKSVQKEKRKKC